jgi:hypothetical protein
LLYFVKAKNNNDITLATSSRTHKLASLRYVRAVDDTYKLLQGNKPAINIIPLNSLDPISSKLIDWEHYKSLINKNERISIKPVFHIVIEKDKILNTLVSFYSKYKSNFEFIPKTRKGNLPGSIESNIIHNGEIVQNAISLAVVIDKSKFFVINIDNNSKIPQKIKQYIYDNLSSMCISYHSENDLDPIEVVTIRSFKLFFKCNESLYQKLLPLQRVYANISTEISFNGNYTVIGYYRSLSGSQYKFIGDKDLNNLQYPSDKLVELLIQTSRFIPLEGVKNNKSVIFKNISQEQANNIISAYIKHCNNLRKNKFYETSTMQKISSECPFVELHTTQSSNSDFDITYKSETRTLLSGCWRNSCRKEVHKFIKPFVNKYTNSSEFDVLMPINDSENSF